MLYQSYEKPHPSRTQRPIYGTPLMEPKNLLKHQNNSKSLFDMFFGTKNEHNLVTLVKKKFWVYMG